MHMHVRHGHMHVHVRASMHVQKCMLEHAEHACAYVHALARAHVHVHMRHAQCVLAWVRPLVVAT